ncbi:hypothetical protein GF340_02205 [Candidatus Peregrinibacteria bacterium]|nr:hypothetical protein [Candidatus Peregrinibacteria bacterium]
MTETNEFHQEQPLSPEEIIDTLNKLESNLPNLNDVIYEFAKYVAANVNSEMSKDDFADLTGKCIDDLQNGKNSQTGKQIDNVLAKFAPAAYNNLRLYIPVFAEAVFSEFTAPSSRTEISRVNDITANANHVMDLLDDLESDETLETNLKEALAECEQDPNNTTFKRLIRAYNEAKNAGLDMTGVELKVYSLQQNVLSRDLAKRIYHLRENPNSKDFQKLADVIKRLQNAGLEEIYYEYEEDIEEVKALVLRKKISNKIDQNKVKPSRHSLAYIEGQLAQVKKDNVYVDDLEDEVTVLYRNLFTPRIIAALRAAEKTLNQLSVDFLMEQCQEAKRVGVDLTSIEKRIVHVQKGMLRMTAEKHLKDVETEKSFVALISLIQIIKEAKEAGADVIDIEEQIPRYRQEIVYPYIETKLFETQNDLNKPKLEALQNTIEVAKEMGLDVRNFEKQVSPLLDALYDPLIQEQIIITRRQMDKNSFNDLKIAIKRAEIAGANVSKFENDVKKLQRRIEKKGLRLIK